MSGAIRHKVTNTVPAPVSGALFAYDATVLGSISRGILGPIGTSDGQFMNAWASQQGGPTVTQATVVNYPMYDEISLGGAPATFYGGGGSGNGNVALITAFDLPSTALGIPLLIFMVGRGDVGTFFELSADVTIDPGFYLNTGSSSPIVAVKGSGPEQTATQTFPDPGWTPLSLGAKLACFIDSSHATVVGGAVSQLTDQSGNGFNYTDLGNAAQRIPFVASGGYNNLPYLQCANTGNLFLDARPATLAPPWEVYDICLNQATFPQSATYCIFGNYCGGHDVSILASQSELFWGGIGVFDGATQRGALLPTSVGNMMMLGMQGPAVGLMTSSLNGGPKLQGTAAAPTLTFCTVGAEALSGSGGFEGQWYARVMTKDVLTPTEYANLKAWAQFEYGIGAYINDDTYHTYVFSTNGLDAGLKLFRNDQGQIDLVTNAVDPGAGGFSTVGTIGSKHALGDPATAAIQMLYGYPLADFTGPQLAQMQAYAASKQLVTTGTTQNAFCWAFGDSIMETGMEPRYALTGRFASYVYPNFGQPQNDAVAGNRLDEIQATFDLKKPLIIGGILPNVILVNGGTNDILQGADAATVEARMMSLITDMTAWLQSISGGVTQHVIMNTIFSPIGAPYDAVRIPVNVFIRANYASWGTANVEVHLVDGAADPIFSTRGSFERSPYFLDDIHLTELGIERWFGLHVPTILAIGL